MALRISRRAAIKGLGGVAITLPALEVMFNHHGEAYAQGQPIPKRYIVAFGGQSLGGDGDPLHNDYVPNTTGPNYDLKSALAPLADVQSEVSVVSGLSIPTANGGAVPTAGPLNLPSPVGPAVLPKTWPSPEIGHWGASLSVAR